MKLKHLVTGILIVSLFNSCGIIGPYSALNKSGEAAYTAGNYEEALNNWEQIISDREGKGKSAKAPVYASAGKAAVQLKKFKKAETYFQKAINLDYNDAELYFGLSKCYRDIDNLSREMTALETYIEKYPAGVDLTSVQSRLFETYVESENWDLANTLWQKFNDAQKADISLMAGYLLVNQALKNDDVCQRLAKRILKAEPKNVIALEYYAKKYFWRAEKLYTKEMKAYEKKKTHKQYAILLKALKKVNKDFKQARDYYEKLYKIAPSKGYAKYLKNTYTRLNNKKKAAYYKKRAK